MAPEERSPGDPRGHALRASLTLWLLLPLLAQALLVAGGILVAGLRLEGNGATAAAIALAAMSGMLGYWNGRREDLPPSWLARYAPVFVTTAAVWLTWALEMHVGRGDFTRLALPLPAYVALYPWIGLAFFSIVFGAKWLWLAVPTAAFAAYAVAFWLASRRSPATRTAWAAPAGVVLAALAVLIASQWQQRAGALVPGNLAGHRLAEELDLHEYRPFAEQSRLVPVPPQAGPRFELPDAPRLDGATAAYPLYAAMAQAFYTEEAARKAVMASRTSNAYERLIKGDVDAIFVAQASEAHERMAREKGVGLQFTSIAREAFVFLVNDANPVRGLTAAQVRSIYAGRIQQWEEVGGKPGAIVAFQRPANSGSQTVMTGRVMQGEAMRPPLHEEVVQGMGGVVRGVAVYRNAPQSLGYSFRYYVTAMRGAQGLRMLAIDGVEPTRENVRTGTYPYTVDVFMVTTQRSRPQVERLRQWLLGPQGQKLVEDVGYVAR